jgi:hypothetical protein
MATPTTTLVDVLRERWDAADHANQIGTGASVVVDALENLIEALIREYRVYVNSSTGESVDVGAAWSEAMAAAALEAGRAAWRDHVEPAVISAIAERIPDAPAWFVTHPESEQLRADLATLGAERPGD